MSAKFDRFKKNPPPCVRKFGVLQVNINSSVRIWQTPSPLWCGRPLWMTLELINNHPRVATELYTRTKEIA